VSTIRFGVVVVVFIFTLVATGSHVVAQPDTFTAYGAGTAACSAWTDHLGDKAAHAGDLQWVLGFASAAGVFAGVQLKADPNAFEPFMAKYCQDHPTDTITSGAANLVGNLR